MKCAFRGGCVRWLSHKEEAFRKEGKALRWEALKAPQEGTLKASLLNFNLQSAPLKDNQQFWLHHSQTHPKRLLVVFFSHPLGKYGSLIRETAFVFHEFMSDKKSLRSF